MHTGAIFCRLGNNNTESAWQSAAGRVNLPQLLRDRSTIFSKSFWFAWNVEQKLFDSRPTVAWPPKLRPLSRDRSVTSSKFFLVAWNVQIRCLTVGRRSRDLRPLSRDRSVTFYKNFPNCLKRPKTLLDSRPTVAWPPTTAAWPFSDLLQKILIAWNVLNVVWQSADGRVTSDHCRVTVQLLFSKCFLIAWNVQKRCLTDGRRSRDLRPLSRDLSATLKNS